jgi:hypothetical protein
MSNKTHYRKVLKSDHLGVADLEEFLEEGKSLVFTIKQVKQEYNVSVAGRKGDHNIAYFKESIKPLVLNATNAARIRRFCKNSPFVEDWSNVLIELYIDSSVKMKGEIVGGVRVKTRQPKATEPKKVGISPASFSKAQEAVKKGDYTIEQVEAKYILTPEQKAALNE